jgi:hypothetical protein
MQISCEPFSAPCRILSMLKLVYCILVIFTRLRLLNVGLKGSSRRLRSDN